MTRLALLPLVVLASALPGAAWSMAQSMPDMDMSSPAPAPAASTDAPAAPTRSASEDEPDIPKSEPPPPPADYAADRFFSSSEMGRARSVLQNEHGGEKARLIMGDRLEYQTGSNGESGHRWDGELRYGGDINRLAIKSEGEGSSSDGVDDAEVQLLYSRAVSPYWDVQFGLRQDFEPHHRTYATVGVEGLAPYWFDLSSALFVSNKGEVLGRATASYDLRLTQRLLLQPRIEMNLSVRDNAELGMGAGLSDADFGLRLRYEVRREFAPYIGVSYQRKFDKTADYARSRGEDTDDTQFVAGVHAWF